MGMKLDANAYMYFTACFPSAISPKMDKDKHVNFAFFSKQNTSDEISNLVSCFFPIQ